MERIVTRIFVITCLLFSILLISCNKKIEPESYTENNRTDNDIIAEIVEESLQSDKDLTDTFNHNLDTQLRQPDIDIDIDSMESEIFIDQDKLSENEFDEDLQVDEFNNTENETVTDSDIQTYKTNYADKIFFRGTPNDWSLKKMDLIEDYLWSTKVTFGFADDERFLFYLDGGSKTTFFGDNESCQKNLSAAICEGSAETADKNDIKVDKGTYTITFNENTKNYTIVLDDSSTPAKPANLKLFDLDYSSVSLRWDVSDNVSKYIIKRGKSLENLEDIKTVVATNYYRQKNWNFITSNIYTDSDVKPGETYFYKVISVNSAGETNSSEVIQVKLPYENEPYRPYLGPYMTWNKSENLESAYVISYQISKHHYDKSFEGLLCYRKRGLTGKDSWIIKSGRSDAEVLHMSIDELEFDTIYEYRVFKEAFSNTNAQSKCESYSSNKVSKIYNFTSIRSDKAKLKFIAAADMQEMQGDDSRRWKDVADTMLNAEDVDFIIMPGDLIMHDEKSDWKNLFFDKAKKLLSSKVIMPVLCAWSSKLHVYN